MTDYAALADALNIRGNVNNHQLVTRCPMHNDTQPSFSLNVQTGLWTCFAGCGAGNFYQLVMKVLGLRRAEAADWILKTSGMVAPTVQRPIDDVNRDYIWQRQYDEASPNVMPEWLLDRGFTWETIMGAGIRWDERRSQLLIPFYVNHQILGLVRRNFKDGPKYQNTPQLPRSQYLYNLPAQAHGPLIYLVEGALDQLWLQQCGFLSSSALLGLKLSDDHIRLLHGYEEVCLALDSDGAGRAAAEELGQKFVKAGRRPSTVTTVQLPPGRKDVGECEPQELEAALAERKPV